MGSIEVIITALAVWRASEMISDEEGPFSIFARLRSITPKAPPWGWIGRGFDCPWCVSFWAALVAVGWLYLSGHLFDLWMFPLWWFGLSGGSCFLTASKDYFLKGIRR